CGAVEDDVGLVARQGRVERFEVGDRKLSVGESDGAVHLPDELGPELPACSDDERPHDPGRLLNFTLRAPGAGISQIASESSGSSGLKVSATSSTTLRRFATACDGSSRR